VTSRCGLQDGVRSEVPVRRGLRAPTSGGNMKRIVVLGAVVAAVLALASGGLAAQRYLITSPH